MSAIERWGQSDGWLSGSQNRKQDRAVERLRAEVQFHGMAIDGLAAIAGRTMDRTADLYHHAVALSGGDENLQGALMGEVGGFIGNAGGIQRNFRSQLG